MSRVQSRHISEQSFSSSDSNLILMEEELNKGCMTERKKGRGEAIDEFIREEIATRKPLVPQLKLGNVALNLHTENTIKITDEDLKIEEVCGYRVMRNSTIEHPMKFTICHCPETNISIFSQILVNNNLKNGKSKEGCDHKKSAKKGNSIIANHAPFAFLSLFVLVKLWQIQ